MSRLIITFLVCCFLGAIIFIILLLTVSFKAYLITVLAFGLFGVIIDWAKHTDEYEKRRD